MEQLTGLDASFLYMETPSLHMHVSMVAVLDPSTVAGGYSYQRLRDLVGARLALAPVFRRRLVEVPFRLGHPYWIDDQSFDLDYHMHRAALPSPGGLEELAQFVGDVCSRQLDRSKPLWEMHVVEGLQHGRIAMVSKIHHSTIDGVSGAELLAQLFDLEADPPPRELPNIPRNTETMPSDLQLIATSLSTRLAAPMYGRWASPSHCLRRARRLPPARSSSRWRRTGGARSLCALTCRTSGTPRARPGRMSRRATPSPRSRSGQATAAPIPTPS